MPAIHFAAAQEGLYIYIYVRLIYSINMFVAMQSTNIWYIHGSMALSRETRSRDISCLFRIIKRIRKFKWYLMGTYSGKTTRIYRFHGIILIYRIGFSLFLIRTRNRQRPNKIKRRTNIMISCAIVYISLVVVSFLQIYTWRQIFCQKVIGTCSSYTLHF